MVSIQVLATPMIGLLRSSPVKPIALNIERAPARSRPSVMRRLRCLRSIGVKDYDRGGQSESFALAGGLRLAVRWPFGSFHFEQRLLPCEAPAISGEISI